MKMPLSEKALKSSLDSGALCSVYIVYGNDGFLKKQSVNRIIKAAIGEDDGFNLLRFELEADLQELYDELNGFAFSGKKCVILTDYDIDDCSKNDFEKLLSLAGDSYESSVFIIYFDALTFEMKKADRLKALISAAEKAGGAAVQLDHREKSELIRSLVASAKKQGSLLSPQNAGYLIDVCSLETQVLSFELAKLTAYANGKEITRQMIDSVAVRSVEASIYDLSAKIMNGDTAGAMALLDDLFFMRVKPEFIVINISSAFVDMFRVAAAKDSGETPESIAADFKMKGREFVLRRALTNFRQYDYKKLDLSFDALLAAERKIKSYSSNERAVIEELIVRLIYIMRTGEAL